jgi:hypothetical protein
LTGEEVNGLLAPGKLYAGRLYTFDFELPKVSEKDESIVYHEERYIRMFLRSRGLFLRKLSPGTFLKVADQEWVVTIHWEDMYFKWTAQSQVSGLLFRGDHQQIELTYRTSAAAECSRLLGLITSQIPAEQIHDYTRLKEQVLSGLERKDYSTRSPACEFRVITQSESRFEYGIFLEVGNLGNPLFSAIISSSEPMDHDAILDAIVESLDDGDLSAYNIINTERFLVELAAWVHEHIPAEIEWSEGEEGWTVTLLVDTKRREIEWVAKEGIQGEETQGIIDISHEIIEQLGQENACNEMRRFVEEEVLPSLPKISNLEDVLDLQIAEVVQRIILGDT